MTARPETLAFVGSYAPADRDGIYTIACGGDGALRLVSALRGVFNPSFLAVDPTGSYLYAVSETGVATEGAAGMVHAFRIDGEQGEADLSPIDRRSTGGDHPCHLAIDPSRRWLAVANYSSGSVAVFPIETHGGLGERASLVRHSGSGPRSDRQQGPHAHSSVFAPDGRFLIVADLGADRIIVYRFDPESGALTTHESVEAMPGAGPRYVVFHPNGQHVFIVNELDNTVAMFEYDGVSGSLRRRQRLSTLAERAPSNTASHVQVSETGRHVYVSNRGDDSLVVYAFDPAEGLTRSAIRPCGGSVPRGFDVLADERHMVVANQASDEIAALPLLRQGADIGEPVATLGVLRPTCVVHVPRSPS